MKYLSKNTTYYIGKPQKEGELYGQKTVFVDNVYNKHESTIYAYKVSDFKNGQFGSAYIKAVCISQSKFDKLKVPVSLKTYKVNFFIFDLLENKTNFFTVTDESLEDLKQSVYYILMARMSVARENMTFAEKLEVIMKDVYTEGITFPIIEIKQQK
jgi:hypothetical protein